MIIYKMYFLSIIICIFLVTKTDKMLLGLDHKEKEQVTDRFLICEDLYVAQFHATFSYVYVLI